MLEKDLRFTESVVYRIKEISRYLEINGKDFFTKLTTTLSTTLTAEEFRTLDVIKYNNDICQRDLAKLILRDRVRTGRILDSLEEKKLIRRFGDMKNKRLVKKMELTDEGTKTHQEVIKKLLPVHAQMSEKISQEQLEELKRLLGLLKEALVEMTEINI